MVVDLRAKRRLTQLLVSGLWLAVLLLHTGGAWRVAAFERLEAFAYDTRLTRVMSRDIDDRVVIVDIDEKSLRALGRWPWPRDITARLVGALHQDYAVAALGIDIYFPEPDSSSGLPVLKSLASGDQHLRATVERLAPTLDYDARLAQALSAGVSVPGFYLRPDTQQAGTLPASVLSAGQLGIVAPRIEQTAGFGANLAQLARASADQGFTNMHADSDGAVRAMPMLMRLGDAVFLPLSVATLRAAFGATLRLLPADSPLPERYRPWKLDLDGLALPLDEAGRVRVPYRARPGYVYLSAVDIVRGNIPPTALEGRIVLIGTTAPGLADLRVTPVDRHTPGVEIHANLISALLDGTAKHLPRRAAEFETLLLLVVALPLLTALVFLGPLPGLILSVLFGAGVVAGNLAAWNAGLVLPLALPLLAVLGLYAIDVGLGFFAESRAKRQITRLFGQYVPPELATEMSRDPTHYSMQGQSRDMTVLFSDIRGFTNFSEKLPPTELAEVLNAYLSRMTAIVQRNRGTIDKYIGDAIMAFWNAPVDMPGHAEAAVQTALDMQAALPELNREFAARGWPEVKIGVGVNTGRMSVGNMGSEFRMSYTVMGDAVNLGSRLEGITKQYGIGILATETTVEADPAHVFLKVDVVRVKGKEQPVAIYQPLGRKDELPEQAEMIARLFGTAFERYQARDWEGAEGLLRELLAAAPCALCDVYLVRIAHFRDHPPPADWDGVYVYTTK